jgi:hypothetical protein
VGASQTGDRSLYEVPVTLRTPHFERLVTSLGASALYENWGLTPHDISPRVADAKAFLLSQNMNTEQKIKSPTI